jgi:hypothetical protein
MAPLECRFLSGNAHRAFILTVLFDPSKGHHSLILLNHGSILAVFQAQITEASFGGASLFQAHLSSFVSLAKVAL